MQWNGETPEKELAYRIIAEQVPLNIEDEEQTNQGIQMLLRYMAALYVNPGGVKPDIKVSDVKKEGDEILLTIENNGDAHQILSNPRIQFIKGDTTHVLRAQDMPNLDGQNVLGGATRVFKIPSKLEIDSNFKANIRVD